MSERVELNIFTYGLRINHLKYLL